MITNVSRWSRRIPRNLNQKRCFVALAHQTSCAGIAPKPYLFAKPPQTRPDEFYLPFNTFNNLNFRVAEEKQDFQDRYNFDEESDLVGQGFFAKVYKAVDSATNQTVAVKVVNKKKCPREIFNQELKVMNQLKNIGDFEGLGLHKDVFETDDDLCFVFDFHSGGDLFDEVVDNGALNEEEARTLMESLLPSLDSLHANSFVHRDIKLENILLSKNEKEGRNERLKTVKLTDFGYAKKLGETDKFKNPAGTFGYVAPEVLESRRYGPQCDVWSMGTVLFTVVAGYQPFPYKSESTGTESPECLVSRELEAIQHGTQESTWEKEMEKPVFKNVSSDLKDLLARMLDPNPKTRITASEVMEHSWMTNSSTTSSPEPLQSSG